MESKKLRGCTWDPNKSRWVARIFINGEQVKLGQWESQEDAALAYDYAASRLGRKVNFAGRELPERIVRSVRPKILSFERTAAIDERLATIDSEIIEEGELQGAQWAALNRASPEAIEAIRTLSDRDLVFHDAAKLAEHIGAVEEYDDYVSGDMRMSRKPIRSKLHRLAFMRSFVASAKRFFTNFEAEKHRQTAFSDKLATI